MSETPRTDAAEWIDHMCTPSHVVESDFARQLERELAAAEDKARLADMVLDYKQQLAEAREQYAIAVMDYGAIVAEKGQLREQRDRLVEAAQEVIERDCGGTASWDRAIDKLRTATLAAVATGKDDLQVGNVKSAGTDASEKTL